MLVYFCLFAVVYAQLPSFNLPPPFGPYNVGVKTAYCPAPKNKSPPRDIMTSIWYPTLPNINSTTYPLAPIYDPATAAYSDRGLGLPSGFAGSVLSGAHANAPFYNTKNKRSYPGGQNGAANLADIIFFSPGYGNGRLDYTATLTNLASYGYIVVGVDHPNDTAFIAYPGGRNVEVNVTVIEPGDVELPARLTALRVQDIQLVRTSLACDTSPLPELRSKLDLSHVGVFGHSLGGSAAAAAVVDDNRHFIAGVNLDGALWGPPRNATGAKNVPFMIIASQDHTSCSGFPDWHSFWKKSRGGFELEIQVAGARHGSFQDLGALYPLLRQTGVVPDVDPTGQAYGTIGPRILEIEASYLSAFFEYAFTARKDHILKAPSKDFPEVTFFPIHSREWETCLSN